ncbi:hypothetical protein BRAO285_1530022 [Bradyrhizobium sp. ORS 285]|nr:hypothetical protein BRAO285_1530022 [Bradyrhizobium sp. ORS 285]
MPAIAPAARPGGAPAPMRPEGRSINTAAICRLSISRFQTLSFDHTIRSLERAPVSMIYPKQSDILRVRLYTLVENHDGTAARPPRRV